MNVRGCECDGEDGPFPMTILHPLSLRLLASGICPFSLNGLLHVLAVNRVDWLIDQWKASSDLDLDAL